MRRFKFRCFHLLNRVSDLNFAPTVTNVIDCGIWAGQTGAGFVSRLADVMRTFWRQMGMPNMSSRKRN